MGELIAKPSQPHVIAMPIAGRAGRYPARTEAELITLEDYTPVAVTPWQTASRGKAVICDKAASCRASMTFNGREGRYGIAVAYFDTDTDTDSGKAQYFLAVNGDQFADLWHAGRPRSCSFELC